MTNVTYKTKDDFKNSLVFHEDTFLMKAQQVVVDLMTSKKFSQQELAAKMGVTPGQISRLLEDGRNLTLRSLAKMSFFLGFELTFGFRPLSSEEQRATWTFPFVSPEALQASRYVARPEKETEKAKGTLVTEDRSGYATLRAARVPDLYKRLSKNAPSRRGNLETSNPSLG